MGQDQQSYRRASTSALLGLLVQGLLIAVVAITGLWAESSALYAATWHFIGGLPIWIILYLVYHQHAIERSEALEVEQLKRGVGGEGGSIFEEQADQLNLAQRRLNSLYKWGLSSVSLFLAVYLLTVGTVLFWMQYQASSETTFFAKAMGARADENPGVLMAIMAGVAFLAFVVGRYTAGMTQESQWQLLRGGSGYLMGNVLVALLMLVAAGFTLFGNDAVVAWVGLVIPAIMILLGVEIVLSFLASMYRPRKVGEIVRPAFDSRLLGWLTKPESLARIVNETINYQFGFEVSRSWFYQLLAKAITPLIAVGIVVLLLISSVVVVEPSQQAILLVCGKISGEPVGPGIHWNWPWPIGQAQRYPVASVQSVVVGSYSKVIENAAILWTNQHAEGREEFILTAPTLVAERQSGRVGESSVTMVGTTATPAVSFLAVQVHVHYVITDLLAYARSASNPQGILSASADRAVTEHFAGRDVDSLLGPARLHIGELLERDIQKAADDLKLGVQIVYVGVTGIHPPKGTDDGSSNGGTQVAAAFHEQIGAIQERETTIWKAKQQRIQTLAQVAGAEETAIKIRDAIVQLEKLRQELEEAKNAGADRSGGIAKLQSSIAEQEAMVEALLTAAPGQAGQIIYQARAQRWETGIAERSKAQQFPALVAAARYAPQYFRSRAYLDAVSEGLVAPRKYIVADATNVGAGSVYRLDLKDAASSIEGFLNPGQ